MSAAESPLSQALARNRRFQEPLKAPILNLLLLGAYNPPQRFLLVAGRLGFKELPRLLVPLELPYARFIQADVLLLVRISLGPAVDACSERFSARLRHLACSLELFHQLDVDSAPRASLFPGRESDRVAIIVNRVAQAVDPPETQGFGD